MSARSEQAPSSARTGPRRLPRGRRSRHAFSLAETVVSLVILAAMVGIAAPRYVRSLHHFRAEAAARRVAADLDRARARAVHRSTDIEVNFLPALDRYEIPKMPDLDNAAVHTAVDLALEPLRAELLSAQFGKPGNLKVTVIFDGYGLPDDGGSVTVRAGDVERVVTVDAGSGEVTVQ